MIIKQNIIYIKEIKKFISEEHAVTGKKWKNFCGE